MQYRREIDGLRAVAVLPVILFHAGFEVFSGGYVGVDIFFVISGYLITGILIGELERGKFSIAKFYERRARRILPALFAVMLACLPFAFLWMLPSQLKDFSQSLLAVIFFVSNMLFWMEEGYFAEASELKPLLHTWSLAVEEQYYVLFPVLLLLLWRVGRNRVFWIVVAGAVASFLLSEWGSRHFPGGNFYLAPMRVWELLGGSICAFLASGRAQRANDAFSALGLALIVGSIFLYDDSTPFPGVYALAPVVGTMLITLYAGQGTLVARLLSTSPFVGLGLISYSAYLWHQPIFAFARLRSLTHPSQELMAVLAVLSLVLAYATWRWIENPFRRSPTPVLATRRSVFFASGAVGASFVLVGALGVAGHGFEWRFSPGLLQVAAAEQDRASKDCVFNDKKELPTHPQKQCLSLDGNGGASVLLLGDSHALAISQEFGKLLKNAGVGYYAVSYPGCLPLPGFRRFDKPERYQCAAFVEGALSYAASAGIRTVVLTARFPLYLRGDSYNNGEGGVEGREMPIYDLPSVTGSTWNDEKRKARVLTAYEERIKKLADDFNLVLVYPIPEAGWNVPQVAFRAAAFDGITPSLSTSYQNYLKRTTEVNSLFDRLTSENPNILGARVQQALCSNATGRCVNADETGVYYFDDDHLSNFGARFVAPVIMDAVAASLRLPGVSAEAHSISVAAKDAKEVRQPEDYRNHR